MSLSMQLKQNVGQNNFNNNSDDDDGGMQILLAQSSQFILQLGGVLLAQLMKVPLCNYIFLQALQVVGLTMACNE